MGDLEHLIKVKKNQNISFIITREANMKKLLTLACCHLVIFAIGQQKSIYHKGWIDFNKNGTMDVFEDPAQPIDKRVDDLVSKMNIEEKSCQMATLYGYGRVLKDE